MDAQTVTRYRKQRRKTPLLGAHQALAIARSEAHAGDDWEEDEHDSYTREVEGFTITVRAVVESVYPDPRDTLGEYVDEARDSYREWNGNHPEPASDKWPLGLPYTSFHYEGCNRRGDSGYFVPDGVRDWYDHLRESGQSRSVAWDLTREWVEDTVSDYFGGPLTYCVVIVTASRAGVELGSDALGTSYIDGEDGRDHIFQCADDHGMVDTAVDHARDTLARLCAS